MGTTVRARPATCPRPIVGVVTEVDGYVVTVATDAGLAIAVDVEDCRPCA